MNDLAKIRCMMFRSGTSKGAYFLDNDLPSDTQKRNELLLKIMGTPDPRQIDGIGGATSVTTKIAIIKMSEDVGVDLDYKFIQVGVGEPSVDDKPTCGNILTAVGAFGIERGLINVQDGETIINIKDVNTGALVTQKYQTPNRVLQYRGDLKIAGVPTTAAPVQMMMKKIAGAKTGKYLPTGNKIDVFGGVEVTCLDISMPVVFVRADDLGITGYESPSQLDTKKEMFAKLESIREQASIAMGLGSAKGNVIPKIAVLSKGRGGADINIRYFTPHTAHPALAVSAGFCVASGVFIDDTILSEFAQKAFKLGEHEVLIDTPSGIIPVGVRFPSDELMQLEGMTTRSVRLLMDGYTYAAD